MLCGVLFRTLIREGRLTVIDAGGKRHVFGEDRSPAVTMRLHDRWIEKQLFLNPNLHIGEGYMDGRLTVEDGDLYDLLDLILRNVGWGYGHGLGEVLAVFRRAARRLMQLNTLNRSVRNSAHHYDLSHTLYDLFLDRDRQYTCAYFATPEDGLDIAQERKKRHIAAKLLLEPGQRVLEIGSGWGGLAIYLAQETGVEVTGVTLSEEHHRIATGRAEALGLGDRVRFVLKDYREVEGRFDRIVSIGMFEAVGVAYFRRFFEKIRDLLSDDGVALLHSVGRLDGPGATNPWLRKYIFPGGYAPALSEVIPHAERAGLCITDIEILRLHYAETLRLWRGRFMANRDEVKALFDERFCRMWEFYLAGSEVSFRHGGLMVFQLQLAAKLGTVPLTRDYITDWERAHEDVPTPAYPRRVRGTGG